MRRLFWTSLYTS